MKLTTTKAYIANMQPAHFAKSQRQRWLINEINTEQINMPHQKYNKLLFQYLSELKHLKAIRWHHNLPLRGQRTRTNAKTAKKFNGRTQKT